MSVAEKDLINRLTHLCGIKVLLVVDTPQLQNAKHYYCLWLNVDTTQFNLLPLDDNTTANGNIFVQTSILYTMNSMVHLVSSADYELRLGELIYFADQSFKMELILQGDNEFYSQQREVT